MRTIAWSIRSTTTAEVSLLVAGPLSGPVQTTPDRRCARIGLQRPERRTGGEVAVVRRQVGSEDAAAGVPYGYAGQYRLTTAVRHQVRRAPQRQAGARHAGAARG